MTSPGVRAGKAGGLALHGSRTIVGAGLGNTLGDPLRSRQVKSSTMRPAELPPDRNSLRATRLRDLRALCR